MSNVEVNSEGAVRGGQCSGSLNTRRTLPTAPSSVRSARPAPSLLRPLRNVYDRTRRPWVTARSRCVASCNVQSRCSRQASPQPFR